MMAPARRSRPLGLAHLSHTEGRCLHPTDLTFRNAPSPAVLQTAPRAVGLAGRTGTCDLVVAVRVGLAVRIQGGVTWRWISAYRRR